MADPGFSRRGCANSRGVGTNLLFGFRRKLHENERNWTERGVLGTHPLGSATTLHEEILLHRKIKILPFWERRPWWISSVRFHASSRTLESALHWCSSPSPVLPLCIFRLLPQRCSGTSYSHQNLHHPQENKLELNCSFTTSSAIPFADTFLWKK